MSAQTVQTICFIRLSCISLHDQGVTVRIVDKLKHIRPGFHQPDLEITKISSRSKKICVVQCSEHYIERTRPIRDGCDKLLLCYTRPHGPASKDTIARWLEQVSVNAGIPDFALHSFRSAASSAMFKNGMSLENILKMAGCSNARTLQRFYYRFSESDCL